MTEAEQRAREILARYGADLHARRLVPVSFRDVDGEGRVAGARLVLVPEQPYLAWVRGARSEPPPIAYATEHLDGLSSARDIASHLGRHLTVYSIWSEIHLAQVLAEHARCPPRPRTCTHCGASIAERTARCRYCGTTGA